MMTPAAIYDQLIQEGVPSHDASILTAVGQAESSLNPTSVGDSGSSIGLFQVNIPSHRDYLAGVTGSNKMADWIAWLKDPINNIKAAVAVYNSQGLGAWTMFRNGGYQQYLGSEGQGGSVTDSTSTATAVSGKDSDNLADRVKYWYMYLTGQSTDSPTILKPFNNAAANQYNASNEQIDSSGNVTAPANSDVLHTITGGGTDWTGLGARAAKVIIGLALVVLGLYMLNKQQIGGEPVNEH